MSSSSWTADSSQRWRPSGVGTLNPSSVSTARKPWATSARTTLDFPVPDMPVMSTRTPTSSGTSTARRTVSTTTNPRFS